MKNEIKKDWDWLFGHESISEIITSLEDMESPEEYNLVIDRFVKNEGIVIESALRPSDVVIEIFQPFANCLEEYCIEGGDLPGWVLEAIR